MVTISSISQTGSTTLISIDSSRQAYILTIEQIIKLNKLHESYLYEKVKSDTCESITKFNELAYRETVDSLLNHIDGLEAINKDVIKQSNDYKKLAENREESLRISERKRKWSKFWVSTGTVTSGTLGVLVGILINK